MTQLSSKYSFELVNRAGLLLADLSGRAKNRIVTQSRNEADEITWTLDLNEFEAYCRLINQDPKNLLINGSTECRVKRLGTYLVGCQLAYYRIVVSADEHVIEIRTTGFLNLFKDRYTTALRTFTATEASSIAATVISETQALANGSFGITIGSLATVGNHDRTYRRTNIKNLLQNLTKVQVSPFDMEFTYDKVFKTYSDMGSDRPDVIFEYPGNIREWALANDGTSLGNQIIALGAGFGEEAQVQVVVDNSGAQLQNALRQKIITPNDVTETATLTSHANAELAAWAYPFEVLALTVDGNQPPYITDYGIGDRVRVTIRDHELASHINSLYRIERREIFIDAEDNEKVKLYLSI